MTFGPHLLLANSAALEACEISRSTPDPGGGVIEREPDGSPSGLMREVAQQLIKNRRPDSEQNLTDRIHLELEACARRGVTSISDVVTSPAELRAYQTLDAQGRLPVRIRLLVRVFQSQIATWSVRDLGILTNFGSDMLQIGGIKVSVDGGSSAGQAAFYPRDGAAAGDQPVLRMSQDELDTVLKAYHEAGLQVCVHAVGDMAADMALRSFEAALGAAPREDHRHRIEHLGNLGVNAERLGAARRLGLIPVPNPSGLYYLGTAAVATFGPDRLGRLYPFRWLIDEGLPFVGASDGGGLWPVDPLRDIAAAVTRVTRSGDVVEPDQAISIEEALGGYTSRAAWAGFGETRFGTLSPGMIAGIEVDVTIRGGRVVFERQAAGAAVTA